MQRRNRRNSSGTARWLCIALLLIVASAGRAWAGEVQHKYPGYDYYAIGDVDRATPGKTTPGLLLMGGGRDIKAAFQWFAAQAGHGHIVILRASMGDELQNWIYHEVGGVASVQTLVFHSRAPAYDARVLAVIRHADGIFIAGGDQSNYVRFWKGTPVNELIDAHVREGRPLGGTSAGYAILGEWGYGAMDGGSLRSRNALRAPDGPAVTLVDDFITLPLLHGTITDTHFVQRKRLGRLLTFVARLARDHRTAAVTGLAIDQDSALLVDADGNARLLSRHPDGHAWVVVPRKLRQVERAGGTDGLDAYLADRVAPGRALDVPGFIVTGLGTSSSLHLPDYKIRDPAFRARVDIVHGKPAEHVLQGRVPEALEE